MFFGGRSGGGSFGGGFSRSSRNSSKDLIRDVAVNDGLNKFNDFAENITRLDKCDIIRQLYEECVRIRGVDAEEFYCGFYKKRMGILCSRKKDTKNADVSPSNGVESTNECNVIG